MAVVGKRFEDKEYFLADLIMSAEIFNAAIGLVTPYLSGKDTASRGPIVLGTVKGDIHDIGKNIVGSLLAARGSRSTTWEWMSNPQRSSPRSKIQAARCSLCRDCSPWRSTR